MKTADVIVIGAGIQGCATALALAQAGASVIVLERDSVGQHASGHHAGGVRQALRHRAEVALSVHAMALWHRIGELVGDDCGFEPRGHVEVLLSAQDVRQATGRVTDLGHDGFDHEIILSGADVAEMVPALRGGVLGGLFSARDGIADPGRTMRAFSSAAGLSGEQIEEGCAAADIALNGKDFVIDTPQGRYGAARLVNAAGAWGGQIAAAFGEAVPVVAVAPMLAVTAPLPQFLGPVVGLFGQPLSVKQWGDGTVMIGGGFRGRVDLATRTAHVDAAVLADNHTLARDLFPQLAQVPILRSWAAIEGAMADDLPVIGASTTTEGLFHAFGFSAHGFQLAPAVGQILAEIILTGAPSPLLAGLGPERWHQNAP